VATPSSVGWQSPAFDDDDARCDVIGRMTPASMLHDVSSDSNTAAQRPSTLNNAVLTAAAASVRAALPYSTLPVNVQYELLAVFDSTHLDFWGFFLKI